MNQMTPQKPKQNGDRPTERRHVPRPTEPPRCVGRIDDIPTEPVRRNGDTLAEEERHAGITTVLFSVTVAAVALFACFLVAILTVRTALPQTPLGSDKPESEGETGTVPTDPGAILFTPSSTATLPRSDGSTVSIDGIGSRYAVLVDAQTGQILAGKDVDVRFSPASMTKVMTLIVACENLKSGDLTADLVNTEDIHNYVRKGKYKGMQVHWADVGDGADLLEQLYGIGVVSAADCVMMIATYICKKSTPAENEAAFVELMNAEVARMGLQNTHFDNPVGCESEQTYSTASDMAAIMMRALECDLIREILSTPSRDFSAFGYSKNGDFNPSYSSHFYSTLFNANGSGRIAAYEKQYGTFKLSSLTLQGGKTGTLDEKGGSGNLYSLVSFATNADKSKTYICVTGQTMVSAEVMKDAKTIYDTYAR